MAFTRNYLKAETNKLKPLILTHASQFGSTPDGADWCLKALHPSDPLVEVRGIPDQESCPTVMLNYQSTYRVAPSVGATNVWSFEASLLPNPLQFLYVDAYDTIVPAGREINCFNTQVVGNSPTDMWRNFAAQGERWRLCYMSVTVYQDGPDLANQGTLVVCQTPVVGHDLPVTRTNNGFTYSAYPCRVYQPSDEPSFAAAQAMPNAYFNRSREGAYVPLKLTNDAMMWRSSRDSCYTSAVTGSGNWGEFGFPTVATFPYPHANAAGVAPYFSNTPLQLSPTTMNAANPIHGMLNGTWAHICAENVSVSSSFTFYVRCGIEIEVQPTSSLSPQVKLSPPHDPEAIATYFRVARELKDAYPADYNDLGKMWDVVSKAAKIAFPYVARMGPYGAAAATLGGGAVRIGDAIREGRKSGRDKPPAAAIERARSLRVMTAPPRQPKGKVKKN